MSLATKCPLTAEKKSTANQQFSQGVLILIVYETVLTLEASGGDVH